ncbi:outer membrane protein assembly factor BamE [Roseomonas sp. NAR14]|uniref:Outer membrane protein assembly factor BamE n=1 Tax=Roseomonas acroporae TaxID=2937791 RepID=A0A9X1YGB9_9PROT|nr:outer membrane protein assembly factor BamE [Roseomonas acroporae]MCK8788177.1 outer membrane protein assembly factor BamE [Roseomonas acroporae]
MSRLVHLGAACGAALLLAGCVAAGDHATAVGASGGANDRLTVGTVQREIRVGMTSADVVGVLGSPNMVTTDDRRRENWVYDRVSSETVYSSSTGGATALFIGGAASAGAARRSQRTLTIIIRFDEASRVRDFSYRSSSF